MTSMAELADDAAAETTELVSLLENLSPGDWLRMTPSEGWTIADQIGHLAYFDEQAILAATDPAAFADHVNEAFLAVLEDVADLHRERALEDEARLQWFRGVRQRLLDSLRDFDPDQRIPWYGPPMRASSFLIARLMETWAHGTDVADALGASLPVTSRLFHIADLGVRTFSWSFANRSLPVPDERVEVDLTGPSGERRTWNPDSSQSVTGPVEDFCLVVTQRRHVDDTRLRISGPVARRWMEIAQVFAGPPGPGRPPSS